MSNQCCYLCGSEQYSTRPGSVRDNPEIKVLECSGCGLVYLSTADHITENHYEESGMHDGEIPDVSSWLRETEVDDKRRYRFIKERMTNKRVIDFGCGVGGFLENAQQSASSIAGIELEKSLQSSFKKRGLSVFPDLQIAVDSAEKWDIVTAFHVVEHLSDPRTILRKLSSLLDKGGEMIIEVPSSDDALLTLYNCSPFQDFTYWSQHLFLFNEKTLSELVEQAGLKINWCKHIQRYPLSNHLYWLAEGKPGGHQQWQFMNDEQLNSAYESQLASIGKTDTIIAGVSI